MLLLWLAVGLAGSSLHSNCTAFQWQGIGSRSRAVKQGCALLLGLSVRTEARVLCVMPKGSVTSDNSFVSAYRKFPISCLTIIVLCFLLPFSWYVMVVQITAFQLLLLPVQTFRAPLTSGFMAWESVSCIYFLHYVVFNFLFILFSILWALPFQAVTGWEYNTKFTQRMLPNFFQESQP